MRGLDKRSLSRLFGLIIILVAVSAIVGSAVILTLSTTVTSPCGNPQGGNLLNVEICLPYSGGQSSNGYFGSNVQKPYNVTAICFGAQPCLYRVNFTLTNIDTSGSTHEVLSITAGNSDQVYRVLAEGTNATFPLTAAHNRDLNISVLVGPPKNSSYETLIILTVETS